MTTHSSPYNRELALSSACSKNYDLQINFGVAAYLLQTSATAKKGTAFQDTPLLSLQINIRSMMKCRPQLQMADRQFYYLTSAKRVYPDGNFTPEFLEILSHNALH